MTRFENESFTEREKELGDTSERVFEAWAQKNNVPFVRFGFNRPPFQKFYRVDDRLSRQREGSGLGLAIAKAIVEGHDGRIEAEDRYDGRTGARFVIRLSGVQI